MNSNRRCVNRNKWSFASLSFIWLSLMILLCYPWQMLWAQDGTDTLADKEITKAVGIEMIVDPIVAGLNVNIRTTDGVVTLDGTVDNLAIKERSERIALSVLGVRSVINKLELRDVSKSDTRIADDIKWKLINNPATDSYEVEVKVLGGVAVLSGRVDSLAEQRLAEKMAKQVSGVKRVDNLIVAAIPSTRNDVEIAADIKESLYWDRRVDSHLIEVVVKDGEVMLLGSVGSGIEKKQAIQTSWVGGVRGVDASALKVNPYLSRDELRSDKYVTKSDDSIKKAVEQALKYDARVLDDRIKVEVESGVVSLRGSVENLQARQYAVQDAQNTVGVMQVKNFLTLYETAKVPDKTLENHVFRAISIDPYVDNFEILASSKDGTITLLGTVDSFFEKAHAESIVSGITGVKEVNNKLNVLKETLLVYQPYIDDWDINSFIWYSRVNPSTDQSDRKIAENIREQLWWSPFVDADHIKVHVTNGIATLTGTVENWTEWSIANENAYEGGAITVINKLNVVDQPNV